MSRKVFVATALAVGLALVFAAISAADRTRSRDQRAARGGNLRPASDSRDLSETFNPLFRQVMPVTEIEYLGSGEGQAQALSILPAIGDPIERKAMSLIQLARTKEPVEAQALLRRVLDMDLQRRGADYAGRIVAVAYENLAEFYADEPQRQAYLLAHAAAFTQDAQVRDEILLRAASLGDVNDIVEIDTIDSSYTEYSPRDFGPDNSCDGATPVGVPSITRMSIADPVGSTKDRNFLEIVIPEGVGMALEIETTSPFCSTDAECRNGAYDTDIALWSACENGFEDMLLTRDPTGDSGLGWLSKLTTTCLLPDSYWLEVKGQFGNAPKDFDVEVRVIGTCVVPTRDAFEPDDTTPEATNIGHPNSIPDHSSGWRGRENKDHQDHSIFPRNEDDNMRISLTRTEWMDMGTQVQFPTRKNGGVSIPSGPEEDSQLFLLYDGDPHGGVCNSAPLTFPTNYCKDTGDCDPDATPAVPSLPADTCIPLWAVTFPGEAQPRWGKENPLAFNDDVAPGSNLGSGLHMCIPRSKPGGPTLVDLNGFVMRGRGYRPPFPGSTSELAYNYQARALVQGPCEELYEGEPNQDFPDATPLLDEGVFSMYGTWEGSETFPLNDRDIFGPFNFEEASEIAIRVLPFLINPFGDSELSIWAGPNDMGTYVLVEEDDDSQKPNSRISTILPPADEFLGNTMAQGNYYIVVSSDKPVPNWYYELEVVTPRVDWVEHEPNDLLPEVVEYRGNTIISAAVDQFCDINRFQFTLAEPSFMDFDVGGTPGMDTVLNLESVTAFGTSVGIFLRVVEPAGIAGDYFVGTMGYPPVASAQNFTGTVVQAFDDPASGSDEDGCTAFTNAAEVAGNIALVRRGACTFVTKSLNATLAGATGLIVVNSSGGAFAGGGTNDGSITIASVGMGRSDGDLLVANLPGVVLTVADREFLACSDDIIDEDPDNPYRSKLRGCLPPGDYVLSVRGWFNWEGPYTFQIKGVPGCTPTDPPLIEEVGGGGQGYSRYCPDPDNELAHFERDCD